MQDQCDFIILLTGVAFAGLAAACCSLARELHNRLRWQWLIGFACLMGLHVALELVGNVSDSRFANIVANVLIVFAYTSLAGFALSEVLTDTRARIAVLSYFVPAALLSLYLVFTSDYAERHASLLLGLPGSFLASWALISFRQRHADIASPVLILAVLLPLIPLSAVVLVSPPAEGPPSMQWWVSYAAYGVLGAMMTLVVCFMNARAIESTHGVPARRNYLLHVGSLTTAILALLGAGWILTERMGALQRDELRASALQRDQIIAASISWSQQLSADIARAASTDVALVSAAVEPSQVNTAFANEALDRYAAAFRADIVYLTDADGDIIATSNRNRPDSVLGRNITNRDYFRAAIAGKRYSIIRWGTATRSRGIYSSCPVLDPWGRTVGVAATKTNLDLIEDGLPADAAVMLVDVAGKIWLSPRRELRLRDLWTDSTAGTQPAIDTRFATMPGRPLISGETVLFAAKPHIVSRISAGPPGWSLVSLTPLEKVLHARGDALLVTGSVVVILIMAATLARLRTHGRLFQEQEAIMARSIREMERLMGVLSHDLRSPLAASKASVDYLLMRGGTDEETTELLGSIGDQQMRMAELVTRMLDVMRIRNGLMEWSWTRFDVQSPLETARHTIVSLPQRLPQVEVDLSVQDGLPSMSGDAQAIERLVVNLGSNAIKHTTGGRVTVSAEQLTNAEGRWLRLEVQDTGEGMDEYTLAQLGKPFALGDKSSSHAGAGLGITICTGICAAHGGRLTVRTRRGLGSTFTAWLRMDLAAPVRFVGDQPVQVEPT